MIRKTNALRRLALMLALFILLSAVTACGGPHGDAGTSGPANGGPNAGKDPTGTKDPDGTKESGGKDSATVYIPVTEPDPPPAIEKDEIPEDASLAVTAGNKAVVPPSGMLWCENWVYDEDNTTYYLLCGDGSGAFDLLRSRDYNLPTLVWTEDIAIYLKDGSDTVRGVSVYHRDDVDSIYRYGQDLSVLKDLEAGEWFVVLSVLRQGTYVAEVDAYNRSCEEYAFILSVGA